MTTKTYDNMTVTVTCKENEDTEMMELIKKMNDTKTARERTEEFYLPRIKAIGAAKWTEICNQLLELCKTVENLGVKDIIGTFLQVLFIETILANVVLCVLVIILLVKFMSLNAQLKDVLLLSIL